MAPLIDNSAEMHLPVPAPDLTEAGTGSHWVIERITENLARLFGEDPQAFEGRTLASLSGRCMPELATLAREVAERGERLEGVTVRLLDNGSGLTLTAAVHPGGLTQDYRARRILFSFQIKSPPAEEVIHDFHGIVGCSAAIAEVVRKIELYADSDASVVITGETGTGKELVARALHRESPRAQGPYVVMNCAAIAEDLLESELFGHERGAVTGAVRTHRGRFERAHGGSLFLDEIGDMPLHTQSKLLRVLEGGRIERVGSEQEQKVDVRVLCATNVPLERAVREGRFRADLYHRVAVLRIHVPALRSRSEDIPSLVAHFLELFNRKYGRVIHRLTPEALQLLQAYLWPGNVRELRNVLERVYVETRADMIGARAFREWIQERQSFAPGGWNLDAEVERSRSRPPVFAAFQPARSAAALSTVSDRVFDAEILPAQVARRSPRATQAADLDADEIRRAYRAAAGNLAGAACLLGVHRATLYRYLNKLGLNRAQLDAFLRS